MYRKENNVIKNESFQRGSNKGLEQGIHEGIIKGIDLGKIEVLLKILNLFNIEYTSEQVKCLKSMVSEINIDHILTEVIKTQGKNFETTMKQIQINHKSRFCVIFSTTIDFALTDKKRSELLDKINSCNSPLQKFELFWDFTYPLANLQSFFPNYLIHVINFTHYRHHYSRPTFDISFKLEYSEEDGFNASKIQDIFFNKLNHLHVHTINITS